MQKGQKGIWQIFNLNEYFNKFYYFFFRGLPWILAALVATIIVLLIILSYVLYKQHYKQDSQITKTISTKVLFFFTIQK